MPLLIAAIVGAAAGGYLGFSASDGFDRIGKLILFAGGTYVALKVTKVI